MNVWLPWNRVSLTERDLEVLAEVEDAVAHPGASDVAPDGLRVFAARLAGSEPRPSEEFSRGLEARIVAAAGGSPGRAARVGWLAGRVVVLTAVIGAIAVGTGVAMAALGVSMPSLVGSHSKRVAPQVVTTPPVFSGPSVAITPPPEQWIDPLELSKQLGLTVYVPNYLPSGCTPIRSWASLPPAPHVGHLQYGCIGIQVFALDVHIRPAVAPGSVEDLTVGGRPATLIKGSWSAGSGGETIWYEGTMQLFVEHPGVTVGVQSDVGTLTREELLRIAESLQAISAR